MAELILYSRTGCCLCEGLEQRLRELDLQALGLELTVVDIDAASVPGELRARYDLEVPVLQLGGGATCPGSPLDWPGLPCSAGCNGCCPTR